MIRIRPYKDSDEARVLSWCRDEETFYRWTAGVLGAPPLTPARFRKTAPADQLRRHASGL